MNKKNIENADDELQILHPMPMNVGVELDNYAAKNFRMQHIKQLSFGISARTSALKYSLELIRNLKKDLLTYIHILDIHAQNILTQKILKMQHIMVDIIHY